MQGFKQFMNDVRALGGPWASDDVYFTQMRDEYSADYRPEYPASTHKDMLIRDIRRWGCTIPGNYMLVSYWQDADKWHAMYANDLKTLIETAP